MREIASTLLFDTADRFLFQQRDKIVGINEPGKIGLFVGTRVEIGGPIPAEFFFAQNISFTQIHVTEGRLAVATAQRTPLLGGRLTAYAQLALKAFGIGT